jgi:hypothetical protein
MHALNLFEASLGIHGSLICLFHRSDCDAIAATGPCFHELLPNLTPSIIKDMVIAVGRGNFSKSERIPIGFQLIEKTKSA